MHFLNLFHFISTNFWKISAVSQKFISLASYLNSVKTWPVTSEENLLDACGRFFCLSALCVPSMSRLRFQPPSSPALSSALPSNSRFQYVLPAPGAAKPPQASPPHSQRRPSALAKPNPLFLSRISKCLEGRK